MLASFLGNPHITSKNKCPKNQPGSLLSLVGTTEIPSLNPTRKTQSFTTPPPVFWRIQKLIIRIINSYQVIQFVTFLSPNVGGHQQTLKGSLKSVILRVVFGAHLMGSCLFFPTRPYAVRNSPSTIPPNLQCTKCGASTPNPPNSQGRIPCKEDMGRAVSLKGNIHGTGISTWLPAFG